MASFVFIIDSSPSLQTCGPLAALFLIPVSSFAYTDHPVSCSAAVYQEAAGSKRSRKVKDCAALFIVAKKEELFDNKDRAKLAFDSINA
jgi:hypothetical protein